ncbi:hypothetical protein ACT3R4_17580, partial [Halomonas sp. AOP7-E1-9]
KKNAPAGTFYLSFAFLACAALPERDFRFSSGSPATDNFSLDASYLVRKFYLDDIGLCSYFRLVLSCH